MQKRDVGSHKDNCVESPKTDKKATDSADPKVIERQELLEQDEQSQPMPFSFKPPVHYPPMPKQRKKQPGCKNDNDDNQ